MPTGHPIGERDMTATDTTDDATPLRPSQVATRLGVHVDTVYRAVAAGEIDAFRVGTAVRIPAGEVDRILATPAARQPR